MRNVPLIASMLFICGLDREQQARWRAERAQQEKELWESEMSDRREALNQIHDLIQQR